MTLQELRDLARAQADEQSTDFIDNTEIDLYINQGQKYVYSKICQRFEDFFLTAGTLANGGLISVVASTDNYALPTGLKKLVRVERRESGDTSDNNWMGLRRLNLANDRIDPYYPMREGYPSVTGYYLAGNRIYLRPVPDGAFTIRLWFVPAVTTLSSASDTTEIPSDYAELIASYAALQMLRKSGEGIYTEAKELFVADLENMLETIEIRDTQPETMTILDDEDYERYGI